MNKWKLLTFFVTLSMLVTNVFGPVRQPAVVEAQSETRLSTAAVLVNSASPAFFDFQHFIQPYLDHFGIPYTVVDIASVNLTADIGGYALIITGHKQLDTNGTLLDSTEQGYISAAVLAGAGLVSFDSDLSAGGAGRYAFINAIFGFGYTAPTLGSDITIATTDHYITQRHANETTPTSSMTLAGITLPGGVNALATAGQNAVPFLAVTSYGQGRAVQWGTYDWMSHAVKGPVYDLDDLVWRSMIWAARKPFVMQGLPPFVTMRMDDTSGPLDWIHIANEYGFVPWAGLFTNDINPTEAADAAALAAQGKATFGIHAFSTSSFFYYDHYHESDFSDAQVAQNFAQAAQWLQSNQIPVSTYAVGHYYELGTNVFEKLRDWGVAYVGMMMPPGQAESTAQWVQGGPFRLYETGSARDLQRPVYYADTLNIPGHPELAGQFFNCVTEFRDIDNYEWHPSPNIEYSVATGTRWLERAFNNMTLATLFTHEYDLGDIDMTMWRQMIAGITQQIAGYQPIYVSMDAACRYTRAIKNADIAAAAYQAATNQLTTSFAGSADIPTYFYVFYDTAGSIAQSMVSVPAFSGSTEVNFTVPGQLDHIIVSPNPATVVAGASQQFTAQGYDVNGTLLPNLQFTWQVVNGGGEISPSGLFTAGATPGTFAGTVAASLYGVEGRATVEVIETSLDHFRIEPIPSPVYSGIPFSLTVRAEDAAGNLVIGFTGSAALSDSTGTLQPAQTGAFTGGLWTGYAVISQPVTGDVITAADGGITGASSPFDVTQPVCPCSIWDDNATPETINVTDNRPIEVGLKFQPLIDGYITGIRFYKGSMNTGVHTGHLWSAGGTLLATAVFGGETASGWQQVLFDTPVAVQANTTYIASYFSSNGYFSDSPYGLSTAVIKPPLKALAAGEDGPNGVYRYDTPGFPSAYWADHAPNYWVDVLFDTTAAPDTTPPAILSRIPVSGAVGVNVNTNVDVVFNEPLDPATVNTGTVTLRDPAGSLVPSVVTYTSATRTVVLDPISQLPNSTTFTVTVKGGPEGVKDQAGNALAADISWSFTSAAPPPPPPNEGPGGPILIISDAANPFSRYYTEILRAEGLNEFLAKDIAEVTAADLTQYDVVILGEMPLTAAQAAMLESWVIAGGNLIAMRPDARLNALLGISPPAGTLAEGYLRIDTTQPPGQGIVSQTMQYHGQADLRSLNGAAALAVLYQNANVATSSPALTINNVGSSGGQAAAFAFDLARSVVYTRQGNPNWAGQERDGNTLVRPDDMFYGNAAYDPQPDWVNLSQVAVPQADEQQRLLANLILHMNSDRKPLPRFWYLPRGEKAAVIMTGDDHDGNGTEGRFNSFLAQSPAGCSVDDWECIRATSILYPTNLMTNAAAAAYQAQGFEITLHVNTNCTNFTPQTLEAYYSTQLAAFQVKFPSIDPPLTERTHCIAWSDWDSQVTVKLNHQIRMDLNYYYWPPDWIQNRPGVFTGSGMPMRFANLDGSILDVYQAATQMTDESGQTYPYTIDMLLDRALGPEGYYGMFAANMHNDSDASAGATAIVNSALERGVPVISARQAVTWLDGRNNSSFENLRWDANTLTFEVAFGQGANGLQVLLPAQSSSGPLTAVLLNGSPVDYSLQTIKGVSYAVFAAGAGAYQAAYGIDVTPPAISGVTVSQPASNTAQITWNTSEPADTRVLYGTAPAALGLSSSAPGLTTEHAVTLTNLVPSTTYFYRVTSRDEYNNSSTWPPAGEPPASFTNPEGVFTDTTSADFLAGTAAGGIYLSHMNDGEVILLPETGEEFNGTSLPEGWVSSNWSSNGSAVTAGGFLTVDGAIAGTSAYVNAGRALEFSATFEPVRYQHAGFAQTLNYFSESWAMFSTWNTTSTLYARTNNAGHWTDVPLAGSWLGVPHRYRIEWTAAGVTYLIDGSVVHVEPVEIAASMRPIASDSATDEFQLPVDWLRMSPYTPEGVFESRIFDAGAPSAWYSITWGASLPPNTTLALRARSGSTPMPDASWSAFEPLAYPEGSLAAAGRYFQYQVALSTNDPDRSPVFEWIVIKHQAASSPPAAAGDTYDGTEDEALSIPAPGVLSNDTAPQGVTLTARLVSQPLNGSLLLNPDGSFTYTPYANFNGVDTFRYAADSDTGGASEAVVTITMAPVNDPPVPVDDSAELAEDDSVLIDAAANDTDVDGDLLPASVALIQPPAHGSAVQQAGGAFLYTPTRNYYGADTFRYSICDAAGACAAASVYLTVTPVNDAPAAAADSVATLEDTPVTFAVISNDTDIDGDTLSVANYTQPAHGTLVLNPNQTFTYTPAANYYGSDSFTYTASDGLLQSASVPVTITVTPVNDAPAAANDSITTPEDTSTIIAVLANDSDADGDPLTVATYTLPAHGSLTLNADQTFTYLPAADYYGSDSFTYIATDGELQSANVEVSITITPVNDAPVAVPDSATTAKGTPITITVLANDSDIDGDTLTVGSFTQPAHGTLALNADQSFTYTPAANYNGSDSFTYLAFDGNLQSASAVVSITVTAANSAPAAAPDSATTLEDTPVTINVLDNDSDPDGDALTVADFTQSSHGTLALNADQTFTYTPAANHNGSDSFTYVASDGERLSDSVLVNITITPVNDAPAAAADSAATPEDTPVAINVLANDSDIDGDTLTVGSYNQPAHGTLALNADQSFTYTPAANYNGTDSFTYRAGDGNLQSDSVLVTITVTPVNDAPAAVNDSVTTPEDTPITINVLANDRDVDGNPLTVASYTQPAHGTLTLNPNQTFTYAPAANYYGSDSFTYRISDGALLSASAVVSITVTAVNDPPVAQPDAYTVTGGTTLSVAAPGLLANDTDIDNAVLTAVRVTNPANGTLVLNANGSFTYTPGPGYFGTDSFTYRASDQQAQSAVTQVTITVLPNIIFSDNFQTGNLSRWSSSVTDGGDLSVTAAAGLNGSTYGMQALIDDLISIYVVDQTPAAEAAYAARFYFDPNTLTMARNSAHLIFTAQNSTGRRLALIELRYFNNAYQLRAGSTNDKNSTSYTNWFTITDGPHALEIRWAAATTASGKNGSMSFWIDSVQQASLTGIANGTSRVELAVLGAVEGLDRGTAGRMYFDEFLSTR